MSNGKFMNMTPKVGCNLFEQLVSETFEWEMARFVTPTLENLSIYDSQTFTSSSEICSCCHSYDHDISPCPHNESYTHINSPILEFNLSNAAYDYDNIKEFLYNFMNEINKVQEDDKLV